MLCSEHPKSGDMSTATGTVTDIGGKFEILNALYDFIFSHYNNFNM